LLACEDIHGHSLSLFSRQLQSYLTSRKQSSPLACGDDHGHPLSLISRLLQSPLLSRVNQVCWHAETIMVIRFHCFQDYYSLICLPKTIKFIGIWRQSWSSAFLVFKTITIFFAFQRLSSLLACKDNHGHPLSFFSRLLMSSLPPRDNQVCWHAQTIMVIRFHYFHDYFSLLSLPRDNRVHWHTKTIMVIRFHCLQDYYNLFCRPETIKSVGM